MVINSIYFFIVVLSDDISIRLQHKFLFFFLYDVFSSSLIYGIRIMANMVIELKAKWCTYHNCVKLIPLSPIVLHCYWRSSADESSVSFWNDVLTHYQLHRQTKQCENALPLLEKSEDYGFGYSIENVYCIKHYVLIYFMNPSNGRYITLCLSV